MDETTNFHKIIFDKGKWQPKQPQFAQHPAVCVTLEGARAYADWKHMSLPTQEQWLLAANPEGESEFVGPTANQAWHRANATSKTHEVKQKNANSRKIYDLYGNVAELLAPGSANNPKAPAALGGHFDSDFKDLSAPITNTELNNLIQQGKTGFRCVKKLEK